MLKKFDFTKIKIGDYAEVSEKMTIEMVESFANISKDFNPIHLDKNVDYYLSGYKAGGPIKLIANLVANLGVEFDIIYNDHDLLDRQPYANVKIEAELST
jgi:hypothetical protein